MKFMTIASGSSGNSTLVGTATTNLLVDVGISKKRIVEGLKQAECLLSDISGILITHEHIDHIRALGVILRAQPIPIYATKDTCDAIINTKELGAFDNLLLNPIITDVPFMIGDIEVTAHGIWHDACDPVCYSMVSGGRKVAIATDMGNFDDYIVGALQNSDIMLIEANHDVRMLQVGSYPYNLKKRILSDRGHLSNERGAELIKKLLCNNTKYIFLGHLSKENNYPDLAYETVKVELDATLAAETKYTLSVADKDEPGQLIEI